MDMQEKEYILQRKLKKKKNKETYKGKQTFAFFQYMASRVYRSIYTFFFPPIYLTFMHIMMVDWTFLLKRSCGFIAILPTNSYLLDNFRVFFMMLLAK